MYHVSYVYETLFDIFRSAAGQSGPTYSNDAAGVIQSQLFPVSWVMFISRRIARVLYRGCSGSKNLSQC